MPLYEYVCHDCKKTRAFVTTVENRPDVNRKYPCACGGKMGRNCRSFSVKGDAAKGQASWIADTTEFIKDGDEETLHFNPVKSRAEMEQICKDKGLIPCG